MTTHKPLTTHGIGIGRGLMTAPAFTTGGEGVERRAGQAAQRGSASLIGLALCAFVVIATLVTADVGALAFARARAQTAADLAALAAVTPHPSGTLEQTGGTPRGLLAGLGSPAERASAVAASNGAEVLACSCGPLETTISVAVRARLIPFGATVQVRADARAVLRSSVAPSASGSPPKPPAPPRREGRPWRRLPETAPGLGGAVDQCPTTGSSWATGRPC